MIDENKKIEEVKGHIYSVPVRIQTQEEWEREYIESFGHAMYKMAKQDYENYKAQINKKNHIANTCKFFRRLSGLSVSAYARVLGISHTYLKELESGIKSNPSDEIKRRISQISGLSYETVCIVFTNESIDFSEVYLFIINELNNYFENLSISNEKENASELDSKPMEQPKVKKLVPTQRKDD